MSVVAWIILGLISGFIGSKIVNKRGEGVLLDIVLGIVGAVVGGWLFRTFAKATHVHPVPGVTGLNIESVFVAVVGAIVVLIAYHAISRR
ncbi:MAG: GlsB/YeaQ/YmgE family stress response membrane protein [Acidobacteriota bacterium]|nr:GlsB/YeaQ/YmgE family stress response membrane protein [Acidobacteriota bacterium]